MGGGFYSSPWAAKIQCVATIFLDGRVLPGHGEEKRW